MIGLSESEKSTLASINKHDLSNLIYQAVQDGHLGALSDLPLSNCGSYVATELYRFGESLKSLREAKSAKNRKQKLTDAMRAGSDLSCAFESMKSRMETEEEEGKLFQIDDRNLPPHRFSANLQVTIRYQWRHSIMNPWAFGSITFHHEVRPRPGFAPSRPKRKPSAAKQERDLQDELSRTWEDLKTRAACSVRDYFRSGGDGSRIPPSFQAVPDKYTSNLNNLSAKFWCMSP